MDYYDYYSYTSPSYYDYGYDYVDTITTIGAVLGAF